MTCPCLPTRAVHIIAILGALAAGCATGTADSPLPPPAPRGSALNDPAPTDLHFPAVSQGVPGAALAMPEPGTRLTLEAALALVLAHSPDLRAAAAEVGARAAERLQAGRPPNPELSANIENLAGSGPYARFAGAETTLQISQRIEIGGDRSGRVRSAVAEGKLAGWDREARRLHVLTTATERFINVLAAQERVDLAGTLLGIARQSQATAAERVAAGKSPPTDVSRAEIQVAQARAQYEAARVELEAARRSLAVLWGAREATFAAAVGEPPVATEIPPAARLEPYLADNPAVVRWADELESRRADVLLAKAKAVPDIDLEIGERRFRDTGDSALVAGISVPLPLLDRNQGAITAANRRVDEAGYERLRAEDQLRADFVTAYGRLSAAAVRLESIRSGILPKARSVFDAVSTGYREGKFGLLSLLDAQRSLFETRLEAVDARADFLKAKAAVEGLIGRRLESVSPGPEEPEEGDQ